MHRYEFSSKVANGVVVIPQEYIRNIPDEQEIRVILIIQEPVTPTHPQGVNGNGNELYLVQSLDELIPEIKCHPSKPENSLFTDWPSPTGTAIGIS